MTNILCLPRREPPVRISDEIKTLLSLSSHGLGEGQSIRDLPCPFCFGGQSSEKAFVLSKKDDCLLFICHRASCGKKGVINKNGSIVDFPIEVKPEATGKMPRIYEGPLQPLHEWQMQLLRNDYGFSDYEVESQGIRYAPRASSLAVPVRSPNFGLRGYMLRGVSEWQQKWDAWQEKTDEPWMSWHRRAASSFKSPLVLVEDQLSAIKVSRHFPAVALLGTELTYLKMQELLYGCNIELKVLALDRDAFGKSLGLLEKWKLYMGGNFSALCLSKDLKYENDAEIVKLIKGTLA